MQDMLLKLQRFHDDGDTTLGCLTLDGEFVCWILEDQYQTQKVYGETRIPEGLYDVIPRTHGRYFEAYKERWDHPFALEIANVPGFTDILFHTGNHDDHTDGCQITGRNFSIHGMTVSASREAYSEDLFPLVKEAVAAGKCKILVKDNI